MCCTQELVRTVKTIGSPVENLGGAPALPTSVGEGRIPKRSGASVLRRRYSVFA